MSLNSTVSDIQFEFAFNKVVRTGKDKFSNGIPHQMVLVFKTICCLPDEELNNVIVKDYYSRLFGDGISTLSVYRNLERLTKLGVIDTVDNPHGKSVKYVWIKLTNTGRRLQKVYLGSTSEWKDRPRIQAERQLKFAKAGGTYE